MSNIEIVEYRGEVWNARLKGNSKSYRCWMIFKDTRQFHITNDEYKKDCKFIANHPKDKWDWAEGDYCPTCGGTGIESLFKTTYIDLHFFKIPVFKKHVKKFCMWCNGQGLIHTEKS